MSKRTHETTVDQDAYDDEMAREFLFEEEAAAAEEAEADQYRQNRQNQAKQKDEEDDENNEEAAASSSLHHRRESHNLITLKKYVLARSVSAIWEEACVEWELEYIYESPHGTCVCGHTPITDHCVLLHQQTGVQITVGNQCVQHFGGDLAATSKSVFANAKALRKDPVTARANLHLIQLCAKRGILTAKGASMYEDNWRKRSTLTEPQVKWIVQMNRQICQAMREKPRVCERCQKNVYAKSSEKGDLYYKCERHAGEPGGPVFVLSDEERKDSVPCSTCSKMIRPRIGKTGNKYWLCCDKFVRPVAAAAAASSSSSSSSSVVSPNSTSQKMNAPSTGGSGAPVVCLTCNRYIPSRVSAKTGKDYWLCCGTFARPGSKTPPSFSTTASSAALPAAAATTASKGDTTVGREIACKICGVMIPCRIAASGRKYWRHCDEFSNPPRDSNEPYTKKTKK